MPISFSKGLTTEVNQIIQSALDSVNPYAIVKELIKKDKNTISIASRSLDLDQINRVFLIGIGKAVLPMAKGAMEVLRKEIHGGVLVPKHIDLNFSKDFPENFFIFAGDHPLPTEKSIVAAKEIQNLLALTTKNDLVIGLISGGGSSLITLPKEPVSIRDLNLLTRELLLSGASIQEMNTIRKHIDQIKGGGLLRCIAPARSIHLILSDVIGDDLSVIASGPTTSDPTTYTDAINVLKRYNQWEKAPESIRGVLQKGEKGEISETIKRDDPLLENVENHIIGSLQIAANVSKKNAESLGFHTEIIDLALTGEARIIGFQLAQLLKKRIHDIAVQDKPMCFIAGGETTVTVTGTGIGGRNQELALAAALELDGLENVHFLTLATDGEDGPTSTAGAIVDGQTIRRAERMGMNARDYLQNNDSYNFFKQTGELIITGPTGTNVNDLVFMLVYPKINKSC